MLTFRSDPFATQAYITKMKLDKDEVTPSQVSIDGYTLTLGDVVAVARDEAKATISPSVHALVEASVAFKDSKKDMSIYGVTTGFGGSADTRTADTEALQISLLEHQLCGFLPVDPTYETMLVHAMPIPIVRGAMAIRINSCVRGHSGVRLSVLQAMSDFLNLGIIPCIPLRGTISASGDLSPLSYIAASICGHPDIKVFDTRANPPNVLSAPEAIAKYKLPTVTLASKEGLGLVNGTAVSASASALALYDAECLAMVAQTNTALTVEALIGQVGSFDPFIHDTIRPHPGQIEAARNIRTMLAGSKLAVHDEEEVPLTEDVGILRQDRYALRTSAQWIGPQLECLALARKQVEVELNSTTDNPLIDLKEGKFHHGGNFQAMSCTSAMDSTRICLQNIGKLAFAQVTELINGQMNRGLPANLAGSDPSTNYHCKGLDIHSAAYTAELGFLANPVSSHVQSTEMHNQSVNSMAFVSARKTMEANDVLGLLLSTQMYCAMQALDLRIAVTKFQVAVGDLLDKDLTKYFGALPKTHLAELKQKASIALVKRLEQTTYADCTARFDDAAQHLIGLIFDFLVKHGDQSAIAQLADWRVDFATKAADIYRTILTSQMTGAVKLDDAKEYLGKTYTMYAAVRGDVGVPVRRGDVQLGKSGRSIGGSVSQIVQAIRDGRLVASVGQMLNE